MILKIFSVNIEEFTNGLYETREGSAMDVENLHRLFTDIGKKNSNPT